MAVGQCSSLMGYIKRVAYSGVAEGATDRQLLEQYVFAENEAAFTALVRRHGSMVHGVCRRVLGNADDADDAFQAVFLVLMRKAGTILACQSIGGWLHGVAYRTALKARASALRRLFVEKRAARASTVESDLNMGWQELSPILDQEIGRLPEKYRLPFVLCYLEGKTNGQAARQLRWPLGTVATRLAKARERLRKRLTQRGAGLAAGLLVATASRTAFSASVSKPVGGVTIGAATRLAASKVAFGGTASERATALAKGVVRAMWMTKVRIAAAVLVAVGSMAGGGGIWLRGAAGGTESIGKPEAILPRAVLAAGQDGQTDIGASNKGQDIADKATAQFGIDCLVIEVGQDGEENVISAPRIVTIDGSAARVLIGQNLPMVSEKNGDVNTVKYRDIGYQVQVTPFDRMDGRFRLECSASWTTPVTNEVENVVVRSFTTDCIKAGRLGDTIEIELDKGGEDGGRCRILLKVKYISPIQPSLRTPGQ